MPMSMVLLDQVYGIEGGGGLPQFSLPSEKLLARMVVHLTKTAVNVYVHAILSAQGNEQLQGDVYRTKTKT